MVDRTKKSAVYIEWYGKLYGYWCFRCAKMTEVYEAKTVPNHLRCTICNFKMGELLDAEYAKMLRENGTLQ